MIIENNFENLIEDLDAIFAADGAPAGRIIEKYGGQDLVKIEALVKWKAGSETKSRRSEIFDIFDWGFDEKRTLEGTTFMGLFVYYLSDIDKKVFSSVSVAVLNLVGYLSKDGGQFLIKSVEIHDIEGHERFEQRALELFAPKTFASKQFGVLTHKASDRTYVSQYNFADQLVDIQFRAAPSDIENQTQKMSAFFEQIGSTVDWLKNEKRIKKHLEDDSATALCRVSLDNNYFHASFRFPDNHKIDIAHIVSFYEDGEIVRTDIDEIQK